MTGNTAKEMPKWIQAANTGEYGREPIYRENVLGEFKLIAEECEFTWLVSDGIDGKRHEWAERVLMVRSGNHNRALQQGLKGRLQRVEQELLALTPLPGRGKR